MYKDHNFWRERRAEADSNGGPSAYPPNVLPLGQTGSLTELRAAVALWSIQDDTEFQFNTDWCGDNKTTLCNNTCPPFPPPPIHTHIEGRDHSAAGEGWRVTYRECSEWTFQHICHHMATKHAVVTKHVGSASNLTRQNVPGWQNVWAVHQIWHDKTCPGDKTCKQCIKSDTTKPAATYLYYHKHSDWVHSTMPMQPKYIVKITSQHMQTFNQQQQQNKTKSSKITEHSALQADRQSGVQSPLSIQLYTSSRPTIRSSVSMQWILSLQVEMKTTQINNLLSAHTNTLTAHEHELTSYFSWTHAKKGKKYLNINSWFIANYKAHIPENVLSMDKDWLKSYSARTQSLLSVNRNGCLDELLSINSLTAHCLWTL